MSSIVALNVAGARPNFMKLAPVHRAMTATGAIRPVFVHTGQHYDENLSRIFLDEFDLPDPDHDIGAGSGTHAEQTARVMLGIEPIIAEVRPDVVVVFGDVNSTIAAALVAAKMGVQVAHVEAGLRSFDRTMPEELNRLLTDALADLLFVPSRDAVANLAREGVPSDRVFLVGNVMIDTLDRLRPRAERSTILDELGVRDGGYIAATIHRPSNVDDLDSMTTTSTALSDLAAFAPTLLIVHPRTRKKLQDHGLERALEAAGVRLLDPLGYVDFLRLLMGAGAILTDSGGIQEEATVLGVPCITLRTTTERPVTIVEGTNRLVGTDPALAVAAVREGFESERLPRRPELWDGLAAERIVDVLVDRLGA